MVEDFSFGWSEQSGAKCNTEQETSVYFKVTVFWHAVDAVGK